VVGAVATQPAAAPAAAVEQLLTAAEGAWRELAAQKQQSTFQMEVYQVRGPPLLRRHAVVDMLLCQVSTVFG
jgi:hypothetical protein